MLPKTSAFQARVQRSLDNGGANEVCLQGHLCVQRVLVIAQKQNSSALPTPSHTASPDNDSLQKSDNLEQYRLCVDHLAGEIGWAPPLLPPPRPARLMHVCSRGAGRAKFGHF